MWGVGEGRLRGARRRLAGVGGALLAGCALLLWGAAPMASAGGPTSVLLAAPGNQRTAALYHSDREYAALERLLGTPARGFREQPPDEALMAADQINVTWMVHDVMPWRIDRVHRMARGKDVWIFRTTDVERRTHGSWYRAARPDELRALFDDLDLTGGPTSTPGAYEETRDAPEVPAAQPSEAASAPPAARAAGGPGAGTGWWWAVPGAVAGAVLALSLRPFVSRRPWDRLRGEPGPRQELRDV
ncbi:hypothetical protein [Streptomyces viridochromogenes]|uniref:hypothetical protein n=2 Tax=Streptomyces TaxID=1883 RepID=UPI00211AF55D|nr:hypothetical protein [Streptomyces viridochromogenes]